MKGLSIYRKFIRLKHAIHFRTRFDSAQRPFASSPLLPFATLTRSRALVLSCPRLFASSPLRHSPSSLPLLLLLHLTLIIGGVIGVVVAFLVGIVVIRFVT